MTTRDDVELLRSFARRHWSPTAGVIGGMVAFIANSRRDVGKVTEILSAVVRLYHDGVGLLPFGALHDITDLRAELEGISMTVDQRKRIGGRLGDLEEACALSQQIDIKAERSRERHAEMAIESITEEIGIHNYHDAARAVLATWRATVQIREDQGLSTKPSAVAASAVNMAVAVAKDRDAIKTLHGIFCTTAVDRLVAVAQEAHRSSCDGSWLVGVKRKWDSWAINDPKARAHRRVIYILRAMRESMDEPLTAAMDETIELLEYMLNECPF